MPLLAYFLKGLTQVMPIVVYSIPKMFYNIDTSFQCFKTFLPQLMPLLVYFDKTDPGNTNSVIYYVKKIIALMPDVNVLYIFGINNATIGICP